MEYKWLFIGDIPILVSKHSLSRQMQVKIWLDIAEVMQELRMKTITVIRRELVKTERLAYIC